MDCKIFAVIFAMTSCVSDLKYGKIPNSLWILGTGLGFGMNILQSGCSGIRTAFFGSLLPLAAGAGLFYFRMVGAGDIKELSAIGAAVGAMHIIRISMAGIFFGAGISILLLLDGKSTKERIRYFSGWCRQCIVERRKIPYRRVSECRNDLNPGVETFHFTLPVYMAVLLFAGGLL